MPAGMDRNYPEHVYAFVQRRLEGRGWTPDRARVFAEEVLRYVYLATIQPSPGTTEYRELAAANEALIRENAELKVMLDHVVTSDPWYGPHSRACGAVIHSHGPGCSNDCPTCQGRNSND